MSASRSINGPPCRSSCVLQLIDIGPAADHVDALGEIRLFERGVDAHEVAAQPAIELIDRIGRHHGRLEYAGAARCASSRSCLTVTLAACGPTRAQLERDNPDSSQRAAAVRDGGVLQGRAAPAGPDARASRPMAVLRQAPVRRQHALVRELSSTRVRVLGDDRGVDGHRRRAKARARRRASSISRRERCCRTSRTIAIRRSSGTAASRASSTRCWCRSPNRNEMGLDHQSMVDRLSAMQGYRPYFAEAFGSDDITAGARRERAVRLRAHADERQRAVRSMELRRRRRRRSRRRPSAAARSSSSAAAARRVTPASISPTAAFTISVSAGMPRRGHSRTKAASPSVTSSAIAARSRRRDSGTSPSIRRTCTTDRSPRFATSSSSTTAAARRTRNRPGRIRPLGLIAAATSTRSSPSSRRSTARATRTRRRSISRARPATP